MHGAVTARIASGPANPFRVRGSHAALVVPDDPDEQFSTVAAGPHGEPGPGVVMVPSARSARGVLPAAALAQELGWPLLVMCSANRPTRAPHVRDAVQAVLPDLTVTACDLGPTSAPRRIEQSSAGQHRAGRQRASVDTHHKRNHALAAAAMSGARFVLFHDDDVSGLDAVLVRRALGRLARGPDVGAVAPRFALAGWPLTAFPDNSVVHHARRDHLGRYQESFIGGAALLVTVQGRPPPMFPPVYNEDWLFLFDPLARREVLAGPPVRQEPYDPYGVQEHRARMEEFGDVLGEGLFHLLHGPRPGQAHEVDVEALVAPATRADYWRPVRAQRRLLLDDISAAVRRTVDAPPPDSAGPASSWKVLHAMAEARSQLMLATPELLADFVVRWREDLACWEDTWAGLPRRDTLRDALLYLGFHPAAVLT